MPVKTITVKYNTLGKVFEHLPDTVTFTLQRDFQFSCAGTLGNCGLTLLQHVNASWRTQNYGRLPQDMMGPWGDPRQSIYDAINKLIKDLNLEYQTKEFEDEVLDELDKWVKKGGYQCVIMSDSTNRRSGARGAHSGTFGTADLGKLLFKRKFGYIVQSPVSLNHVHNSMNDISLIQVWLWYPPGAIAFKPGKFLGAGTLFPSAEAAGLEAVKKKDFTEDNKKKYVDYYKNWNKVDKGVN